MRRLALLALPALAMVACSAAPVERSLGDVIVRVEPADARIQIRRTDGTILLDGIAGGAVADGAPPDVGAAFRQVTTEWHEQYGSFQADENPAAWSAVRSFSHVVAGDDGIRFDLDGGGSGAVVRTADGTLQISLSRPGVNRASAAFRCTPDERFLGFGAMPMDVEHRGATVPIWVSEQGIGRVATDEQPGDWFFRGTRHQSYFPVPFFLSSRNYGVRGDTAYKSLYAMCSETADVWRVEAWEGTVSFHLFYGDNPLDVLARHAALDGAPPVPPLFAFAPWNDAVGGSAVVRQVASELRANHIPSSAIWTEDWAGGSLDAGMLRLTYNWGVDRTLYPDVETVANELHAQGFKWLAYFNTFAPTDSDHFDPQYLIQSPAGGAYTFDSVQLGKMSSLVDLSNPAARDWMGQAMDAAIGLGFDGWMADYGEWQPVDAVLASGQPAEAAHNAYPLLWQQLNADVIAARAGDGVDRLAFVRSGYTGSQAIAHQVVWGGDQTTDFDPGDGLPTVLPIALGLGVAGLPYFGSDVAGYMSVNEHPPSTKELFFRWTTLGALSPILRTHHGAASDQNWRFDSDAETLAHWKRWATLHTKLLPYLLVAAAEASRSGAPMMRPLALGFPDDAAAWTTADEYLLGPSLLVAPVVSAGVSARPVYLPSGSWVRLYGPSARSSGPGTVDADAPPAELPIFARAGTVIAELPDGVDTLVAAAAPLVDLAAVGDARELEVVLGADGQFSETGGLAYTLHSSAPSLPAGATLRYAGAALPACAAPAVAPCAAIDAASSTATVYVTGPGTLDTSDGSTALVVDGGAPTRALTIHLRW